MANKKMTKRDYFNILRASYPATADNYDEVINFIDHELELLAKKNTTANGEKKLTAAQEANLVLMDSIYNLMEDNRLYTITEMIKEFPPCAELNTSKVSAMVTAMVKDGRVNRTTEKRKAVFSKIVVTE